MPPGAQSCANLISGNSIEEVNTADMEHDQDAVAQSWTAMMASAIHSTTHHVFECHAHIEFDAKSMNFTICLFIVDSGADMIVLGGTHWLPLTPLSGILTQMDNVSGFDEAHT